MAKLSISLFRCRFLLCRTGHKSSKMTGRYTHVGDKNIGKIKTKKSFYFLWQNQGNIPSIWPKWYILYNTYPRLRLLHKPPYLIAVLFPRLSLNFITQLKEFCSMMDRDNLNLLRNYTINNPVVTQYDLSDIFTIYFRNNPT